MYSLYVVLLVATVVVSREILLRPWPVLALALAFFAGSMTLDVLHLETGYGVLAEEGLKFLGIVVWTTLLVWLALNREAVSQGRGPRIDP